MIDWTQIPQFAGDLAQLEKDAGTLAASATKIREHGADVHTRFQGLKACYEAPEAEQLFAATAPVKSGADTFGDDLHTVSSALSDYTTEARPLAARLKTLRARAHAFALDVADDDDWTDDHDKVEKHKTLMHDVNTCVQAFYTAEITAANRIQALFCGVPYALGDGKKKSAFVYGVNADVLDHVEKTPWGANAKQSYKWYDVGHQLKSFVWDGFVVDGVWGTLKGLGALAAPGTEEGRQAWKGLAHLATFAVPGGILTVALASHYGPKPVREWSRDSLTTVRETGKALVDWDQWRTNPARAAGLVTFNVLAAAATDGGGAAVSGTGKAGAAARVMSAAGKAGRAVDPMTYVFKGAGTAGRTVLTGGRLATTRLSDVLASIRNLHTGAVPDGTRWAGTHLPEGAHILPDNTVRLPDGTTLHPDGTLTHADGAVGGPVMHEPTAAERLTQAISGTPSEAHRLTQPPTERIPDTVGAGEHAGAATTHAGDDLAPRASHNPSSGADPTGTRSGSHPPTHGPAHNATPVSGRSTSSAAASAHPPPADPGSGGSSGASHAGSPGGGTHRPHLVRQDGNFWAEQNHKGQRKAHFNAAGDLVPANPNGTASIVDHIVGRDPAKFPIVPIRRSAARVPAPKRSAPERSALISRASNETSRQVESQGPRSTPQIRCRQRSRRVRTALPDATSI